MFGGVLRDESTAAVKRLSRSALRSTDRFFQIERLLEFNRKFGPEWVPRYLAVERLSDLPSVGLVVLHLESLLPGSKGATAADDAPSSRELEPEDDAARRGAAQTEPAAH